MKCEDQTLFGPSWPYIAYLLFILKTAYDEFEARAGAVRSEKGTKTSLVKEAIDRATGTFTLISLEDGCPGVSRDMIRRVLWNMQKEGVIECVKRGPGATWQRMV